MKKVLLVEDNEMNRDMLSRRLERHGFEVVLACDGIEGVAAATTERPDLILMDMTLPGIDGWEATRRLAVDLIEEGEEVVMTMLGHALGDHFAGCHVQSSG